MMKLVQAALAEEVHRQMAGRECPWGDWNVVKVTEPRQAINQDAVYCHVIADRVHTCGCSIARTIAVSGFEANLNQDHLNDLWVAKAKGSIYELIDQYGRHEYPAVNKAEHDLRRHWFDYHQDADEPGPPCSFCKQPMIYVTLEMKPICGNCCEKCSALREEIRQAEAEYYVTKGDKK